MSGFLFLSPYLKHLGDFHLLLISLVLVQRSLLQPSLYRNVCFARWQNLLERGWLLASSLFESPLLATLDPLDSSRLFVQVHQDWKRQQSEERRVGKGAARLCGGA